LAEHRVSVHLLPGHGSGNLVVERDHLELTLGRINMAVLRGSVSTMRIRHEGRVVNWLHLWIALPWENAAFLMASAEEIAVVFPTPFARARERAEFENAEYKIQRTQCGVTRGNPF
jgi:hypothetical protein